MNAVEIVFTGLVYLFGTSSAVNPGQVFVNIPNVSEASAPFGHVIPPHYAYVKVRTKDVVDFAGGTTTRKPDIVYKVQNSGDEFAVFALTGDTITLDNQKTTPLTICRVPDCDGDGKKTTYDRIPHRKVVCPECNTIDSLYLTTKVPELVLGRVTVEYGRLSAAHVDEDSQWSFEPMRKKVDPPGAGNYPTQYVADQAVLDVAAQDATKIVLKITPFDAAHTNIATLELYDGAHVEIGNLMFDDAVEFTTMHPPEAVDVHFAHFYTMLTRPFTSHPDSLTDPRVPHRLVYPPHDPGGPHQNCVPLADEP